MAITPTEAELLAEYPRKAFSNRQINDAGRLLGRDIPGDAVSQEAVDAFRVAHNWRVAHGYPLMRERARLTRYAGRDGLTAGRIKTMASIRKKLRRSPINLRSIQDLP